MLVYSCDEAFPRHAATVEAADGPTLKKVTAMSVGDRLAQPIEVQVDDVFRLYREEFPLIMRDLADADGPIVVEGAALLPELVAGQRIPRDRALWIVPTEDFQHRHYRLRGWAHDLLAATADPDLAFRRWMRRDAAFARLVAGQARALGYPVITVDGTTGVDDVAAEITKLLPAA
jgi:hypothetical protein